MFYAYFIASLKTRRCTEPRKRVTYIQYIHSTLEKQGRGLLSPTNTSYCKHLIHFVVHYSFEESGSTLAKFLVFMKHKGLLQRPCPRIYPEQMNSIFFLTLSLFTFHFHVGFPSTTMSRSFLLFSGINVSLRVWYIFVFWFSYRLNAGYFPFRLHNIMCFVPDPYKSSLFTDLQKNQIAKKFWGNDKNNVPENSALLKQNIWNLRSGKYLYNM